MKTVYHLFVNGIPKPQPRPQVLKNGCVYTPHTADDWKAEIKAAFASCRKPTITGPVELTVYFFMPRPKAMKADSYTKVPHTKRPDTDNLTKALMDAMTQAGIWVDDAQVFHTDASKWYPSTTDRTGARIIVESDKS